MAQLHCMEDRPIIDGIVRRTQPDADSARLADVALNLVRLLEEIRKRHGGTPGSSQHSRQTHTVGTYSNPKGLPNSDHFL